MKNRAQGACQCQETNTAQSKLNASRHSPVYFHTAQG